MAKEGQGYPCCQHDMMMMMMRPMGRLWLLHFTFDTYTIMLSVRQWSERPGFNPRSSHTKDSKMVLDSTLLNPQRYKGRIKGKVEQPRERNSTVLYTSVS